MIWFVAYPSLEERFAGPVTAYSHAGFCQKSCQFALANHLNNRGATPAVQLILTGVTAQIKQPVASYWPAAFYRSGHRSQSFW